MGKLQAKKQIKRDALMTAAYDLFITRGLKETSIADIVHNAGVAKGTFYLYFKDKYEVRDHLISNKASQIFHKANDAARTINFLSLEDKIIFWANYAIDLLAKDKLLLKFIAKNLSWGIFKSVMIAPAEETDVNFYDEYMKMIHESGREFRNPEIMIYLIVELISATCHNVILYNEPVSMEELKPDLFRTIAHIIQDQEVNGLNA